MGDAFAIIHGNETKHQINPALYTGSRVARRADQPYPRNVIVINRVGIIDGGPSRQEEQF